MSAPPTADRPMRCLGFRWSVRADDEDLHRRAVALYAACRDDEPGAAPRTRFELVASAEPGRVDIRRDGAVARAGLPPDLALAHLEWEVNRGAERTTAGRLLLHAAAAERGGAVAVLAGRSGAGKSTLAAALVRRGLRYVTDEMVAVEPAGSTVEPYPKPLALDARSRAALGLPAGRSGARARRGGLVAPGELGAVAPSGAAVRLVVLTEHRPGHPTCLEPVHRAEAAVELAGHSFNFASFGPGRLAVLAAMLRRSDCYRLRVGDLAEATAAVAEALPAGTATS